MAKSRKSSSKGTTGGRTAGRNALAVARRVPIGRPAKAKSPAPRSAASRKARGAAVTRVTRETEVRGTETRVERVVERAPKRSLPHIDRTAERGRYVYCIIRASRPLVFGGIGMDERWPDVYTITFKDMAAVVSDIPLAPSDSTRESPMAH